MGCHSSKEIDEKFQIQNSKIQNLNKSNNNNNNKGNFVSAVDIRLVRSSWKDLQLIADFKTHGINMMIKIFLKNPQIKHIWKFAAMLETEEEMRESAQLRSHGNNVFEAINAAVNSLDKIENTDSLLVELGHKHVAYGAKTSYFPIMVDAFLETICEALGDKFTLEHKTAWTNCFNYFVSQMSKGMIIE